MKEDERREGDEEEYQEGSSSINILRLLLTLNLIGKVRDVKIAPCKRSGQLLYERQTAI